jgi:hypothetical protein
MKTQLSSQALVSLTLLTAISVGACRLKTTHPYSLAEQSSSQNCGDLRELLRISGGGAVDIYEDDYAVFIRSSPRYGEFAHIPMDELVAIRAYTHRFWKDLNAALWNNALETLPEVDHVVLRCVVSGMKRLTPVAREVYRQTNLTQTAIDKHIDGALIHYPAFTSTTTDPEALKAFPGNVRFTIEDGRGYGISWLSEHSEEAEVLIPPGRCFLVVSRNSALCSNGVAGPCWHITLKGREDSVCQ